MSSTGGRSSTYAFIFTRGVPLYRHVLDTIRKRSHAYIPVLIFYIYRRTHQMFRSLIDLTREWKIRSLPFDSSSSFFFFVQTGSNYCSLEKTAVEAYPSRILVAITICFAIQVVFLSPDFIDGHGRWKSRIQFRRKTGAAFLFSGTRQSQRQQGRVNSDREISSKALHHNSPSCFHSIRPDLSAVEFFFSSREAFFLLLLPFLPGV